MRFRLAAVALAMTCLAACSSGNKHDNAGPSSSSEPRPSAAVTTSATPSPTKTQDPGMAPAVYRARLHAAGVPVTARLAELHKAVGISALAAAFAKAHTAVGTAIDQITALDPPRAVRAQHADFVQAMRQLGTDLTELHNAVSSHTFCAPTSALAKLGDLASHRAIPRAAKALAAKGYHTAVSMPAAPVQLTRSLPTGNFVQDSGRGGHGQLTIENSDQADALISLAVGGQPAFAVYVRAGSNYTVDGVDDGTFTVYYTTGRDWDSGTRTFTRRCDYNKFDDPLKFSTTYSTGFVNYSTWTITLYTTFDGNAKTSPIDPRNFPI